MVLSLKTHRTLLERATLRPVTVIQLKASLRRPQPGTQAEPDLTLSSCSRRNQRKRQKAPPSPRFQGACWGLSSPSSSSSSSPPPLREGRPRGRLLSHTSSWAAMGLAATAPQLSSPLPGR
ncbi:Hypothetical predicted protein [Marmota monax]|uniref:Uncharacterized protein n=1 Tax=Marmota monax TaxID=9995 RepID=A0A5E4A7Y8_MARMO|nr:hypothetical protein GHT09_012948 [Marmota monax]VTJ52791.1 Hypothetical predicted protein [Marmota monax]